MALELKGTSRSRLLDYLTRQLDSFFPDHVTDTGQAIDRDLDEALDRMAVCVGAVRLWPENRFDYLHSEQNAHFLYFLANTIWRNRANENACAKLFYLNKALNGFSCFYDNDMPDRFLIGHSVGIVLVRATYPEYFVIYQNCTVGRMGDKVPRLGEGTVMYPNSAIVGDCDIGARTIVSQGCSVINASTPGNTIVTSKDGKLEFRKPRHDVLSEYFRI